MDPFEKIKKSISYGALDHKWIARDYLYRLQQADTGPEQTRLEKRRIIANLTERESYLYEIATSAFDYYMTYHDVLVSDPSLRSITEMCSGDEHSINVQESDDRVFHLSNVFNEIIESSRALHRCYDCGTNARAIFLKLIETHRGLSYITHAEQTRMKDEYLVKKQKVHTEIEKCHRVLREAQSNTVCIMSLAIESFGHVWVIEKRFIAGLVEPRYHHYQTSLRSHILLDFIENRDYGRNLNQSLDIDQFFSDLTCILTNKDKWQDSDYYLFAKMFAFLPVSEVTHPDPGFSYTWITY
jgi:hypothetical protein